MGKKLTQKEFIERANTIHNGKYDYSKAQYDGVRNKILIICPIHGEFWQTAKCHLNGEGCPQCYKDNIDEHTRADYRHFIKNSVNKFGNIYEFPHIKTEYKNRDSVITIKCLKCGNVFQKTAMQHLQSISGGCRRCLLKKDVKEYTFDELNGLYNTEFRSKYQIKPFSGIVTDKEKVTLICPIHGEFDILVSTIVSGKGQCRKCVPFKNEAERGCDREKFVKQMTDKYGDRFEYDINEYVNTNTKMHFRCRICGTESYVKPTGILHYRSVGCRKCANEKCANCRIKTTDDYIAQAKALYGDEYAYDKTIYTASDEKVTVKCNRCGKYFSIEANSHLQGHGCPRHHRNKSIMELELFEYIKSIYDGAIISNDRTVLGGNELDIYLPSDNIAFEFDGLYWHNELNKPMRYHLEKTLDCENKGIRLFHIFEDEWVFKKDIIKSMIENALCKNEHKIYARKCAVVEVNGSVARKFYNANHLQGFCAATKHIALINDGCIVSMMSFGAKRHFVGDGDGSELVRFANVLHTSVIGAASKLLKYYIKKYNPNEITSYADRRWSNGRLYGLLGFKLYGKSKPSYYYVIGDKRVYRYNLRKSVLIEKYGCDRAMSEREFCKKQKWHRIYDCGCLCYKWRK